MSSKAVTNVCDEVWLVSLQEFDRRAGAAESKNDCEDVGEGDKERAKCVSKGPVTPQVIREQSETVAVGA